MRQRNIAVGIAAVFFGAGFLPVVSVQAEPATGSLSRHGATTVEERAAVAREHAAIAREHAEQAARDATIAEEQAARAGQRSTSARLTEVERELADLKAKETERGLVLTLGDVLFAPDQAQLTPKAMRKLFPLVTLLKEQPKRHIRIAGYTDNKGTESYNIDLSQRRADAVRDFLIENGIPPDRIVARGYGEVDPVASNAIAAGRQENRRVEVLVPRVGKHLAEAR